MIFDVINQKNVIAIPDRATHEWSIYTAGITDPEAQGIKDWINDKFDEVLSRNEKVQPSEWLESGFDWQDTPLFPIYRECRRRLAFASDEIIAEKSGKIFGLYISLTLSSRPETWCFVKGDEYRARGIPTSNRIYFLPRTSFV